MTNARVAVRPSPVGPPVPILMYHSIASRATPRFKACVVAPDVFGAQMAYLAHTGYTPMTIGGLMHARQAGGRGLPRRPVVLTFDDGYADFYTHALPVLRAHGFVATLYVTSGCIGGTSRWLRHEGESDRAMLDWQQLEEISASGIECGGHTHSHPHLDTLALSEARQEIERSKQELEDRLGQAVSSFAYPYGHYDRRVRELVQAAGYQSACGVAPTLSAPSDDAFSLARVMVLDRPDLTAFAARLQGRGITILPRDPLRPWLSDTLRRSKARLFGRGRHTLNQETTQAVPRDFA